MNVMQGQVGGSHYKNSGMQPHEFCMINAYDSTSFSALKYVHRHPEKAGRVDLEKAIHSLELRCHIISVSGPLRLAANVIPVAVYIQKNNLPGPEACILMDLHEWVTTGDALVDDFGWAKKINAQILDLIETRYGKEK